MGRYHSIKAEERYCKVCNLSAVEELHNHFSCPLLQAVQSNMYVKHIHNFEYLILINDEDEVRFLLKQENVKSFSNMVEAFMPREEYPLQGKQIIVEASYFTFQYYAIFFLTICESFHSFHQCVCCCYL